MEIQNKKRANSLLIAMVVMALVIVILFLRGCGSGGSETIPDATPEVKGKFEAVKPNQIVIHDTIEIIKYLSKKYKSKNEDEFLQKQIDELISENKAVQNAYNEASDSLKTVMYQKAIEPKWFDHTFDDEKLTANVYGTAIGEVKSIKMDYTIKPQKIEAPKQKETYLRVLAGGAVGLNKELNQFSYAVSVGFQNKKGNVIRAQYQKIGSQCYYLAGYEFSLINWKK